MAQKNPKGGGASGNTTTSGPIDNADMFLKLGLEKLLSEKDLKKSQYQQLKRACEFARNSVTQDTQTSNNIPSINETHYLPFELACASNHPRMVDTALDCLQVSEILLHTIEWDLFVLDRNFFYMDI